MPTPTNPYPLTLIFDGSVTSQQESWYREAIAKCRFGIWRASLTITVFTVAEPPAVGHNDYMATSVDAFNAPGLATTYIRAGADDPNAGFNAGVKDDLKNFYMESVIHELGHAFHQNYMTETTDKLAAVAGWFYNTTTGDGSHGSSTTWNDLTDDWADRVQEGVAEWFKDLYMPEQYRAFDSRANWRFDETFFADWLADVRSILCPAGTS